MNYNVKTTQSFIDFIGYFRTERICQLSGFLYLANKHDHSFYISISLMDKNVFSLFSFAFIWFLERVCKFDMFIVYGLSFFVNCLFMSLTNYRNEGQCLTVVKNMGSEVRPPGLKFSSNTNTKISPSLNFSFVK